jgi:hypothetical protein
MYYRLIDNMLNFTFSVRKDILKLTNSRCNIVCKNPQRAGWGLFFISYVLVVIDKAHTQQ